MRIRKCASRLLGSSASAPALPRFELPAPSPPPAHDSHAGLVAASAASACSSPEPCELSSSPWDLMAQLDLSDPQEEKIFFETYLVAVAWRASWLYQLHPSMRAVRSIKEEEQQEEDDMAANVIFQMRVCKKNAARKREEMNNAKIKTEESDAATGGGETPVWTCKKNGGKGSGWFCPRPVSQPNSLCSYHLDRKRKRKRDTGVAEGFYYYAGFDPSRSKKRRIASSHDGVPETPPAPAGQREEASPDPEEHIGFTTGDQAQQADDADHQAAASVQVDEPMSDDAMAGIAGFDEESSDDDVVKSHEIKSTSPVKKRWRKKPVKARSLKSLMYG